MGHLFDIPDAVAEVVVRTRDHCEPHVHVFCRAERWEAKVEFSFLDDGVRLRELDVARNGRDPGLAVVNMIKVAIRAERARCREEWWRVFETTCLENKWLTIDPKVALASRLVSGARQVEFARYNPILLTLQIGIRGGPIELVAG